MASATFSPNHVFGDRFRVVDVLGVGHTTEVYLTIDSSLGRQVAVTCLRPELEVHEDIRRAFRAKMLKVAGIHHGHIAAVLDGGQQDGHLFMVSEYLPNGSLERQLSRGVVFSPAQVARLGRDVATGLAVLHENDFVLGELTPTDLLFDEQGAVRIASPVTSGLGTAFRQYVTGDDVQYFSPEQALGEVATASSDVYALSLILFEAATGVRPFPGYSAEATLRERLRTPLPSRPELGTLDMILALASVPDPTQRLSARELVERLSAVVADGEDFVLSNEPAPSLLAGFTPSSPRLSVGFQPPRPAEIVGTAETSSHGFATTPVVDAALSPLSTLRRRRRPGFLVAAAVLVAALVGGGAAWQLGYFSTSHTVPSVVGLSMADAAALVKSDGFTVHVTANTASSTVPANVITSQVPAAGSSLASGGSLNVVVSLGANLVTLPTSLVGHSCARDVALVNALQLNAVCPATVRRSSATVPAGDVIEVRYRATTNPIAVPHGATLVLVLSTGATTTTVPVTTTTAVPATTTTTTSVPVTTTTIAAGYVKVPDLTGLSHAAANAALAAAQLYYDTSGPGAHSPNWTTVVRTVPSAGTVVKRLSAVMVYVTEG